MSKAPESFPFTTYLTFNEINTLETLYDTRGLREKLESMRRSGPPIGLCPDSPFNRVLSSTFKKRQFFTLTPYVVLGCKK